MNSKKNKNQNKKENTKRRGNIQYIDERNFITKWAKKWRKNNKIMIIFVSKYIITNWKINGEKYNE